MVLSATAAARPPIPAPTTTVPSALAELDINIRFAQLARLHATFHGRPLFPTLKPKQRDETETKTNNNFGSIALYRTLWAGRAVPLQKCRWNLSGHQHHCLYFQHLWSQTFRFYLRLSRCLWHLISSVLKLALFLLCSQEQEEILLSADQEWLEDRPKLERAIKVMLCL